MNRRKNMDESQYPSDYLVKRICLLEAEFKTALAEKYTITMPKMRAFARLVGLVNQRVFRNISVRYKHKDTENPVNDIEYVFKCPKANEGRIVLKQRTRNRSGVSVDKTDLLTVSHSFPAAASEILSAIRGEVEANAIHGKEQEEKKKELAAITQAVEQNQLRKKTEPKEQNKE